ncbi:hypothetical protein [Gemmiger formicilis]|uniref:hypothetical protein n=1 Tax=Gemmiger formicilis TaxID=745368 RepID=UPI002431EF25|nr:hypothetical protein [Gemmiger formicilis]
MDPPDELVGLLRVLVEGSGVGSRLPDDAAVESAADAEAAVLPEPPQAASREAAQAVASSMEICFFMVFSSV